MRPGLFAFAVACTFFGAALYVNIVEAPARLALDARSMLKEWMPSNQRGFVMLALLAVVAGVLGYTDYARSGDVRWLIGGVIILSNLAYAYFVITPVNILLYSARQTARLSAARAFMRDWGVLEWGQTLIGFAACCMLGWPIAMPP
jgi:hypothetical protein